MIEENRLWFVRLKEYLLNRYNRAKATADGIGIEIEVTVMSAYTARIVITNAEVNNQATQEEKYVVRYRIDPPVC